MGVPDISHAKHNLCGGFTRLTLGWGVILSQHVKVTPRLLSFDLLFHPGHCSKVAVPELLLAAVLGDQAEAQQAQPIISLKLQGGAMSCAQSVRTRTN